MLRGRWPGCNLLEANMADIEEREREEDEVTMEITQWLKSVNFAKFSVQ